MAHECEFCGQQCYCDMDDCGGFEQPDDCPHLNGHCDGADDRDHFDDFDDYDDDVTGD